MDSADKICRKDNINKTTIKSALRLLQQTSQFQFLQGPPNCMHLGDKASGVFILGSLLPLKLCDRITAVLITNMRLPRSISQK